MIKQVIVIDDESHPLHGKAVHVLKSNFVPPVGAELAFDTALFVVKRVQVNPSTHPDDLTIHTGWEKAWIFVSVVEQDSSMNLPMKALEYDEFMH